MKKTVSPESRAKIHAKVTKIILSNPIPSWQITLLTDAACEWYEEQNSFSDPATSEEEENLNDPHFLGKKGYEKSQDQERLNKQMHVVFDAMMNGNWMSQQEIADRSGACITSLRARFSDLRSKRWGGHTVESKRLKEGKGTWVYHLIPNMESKTWQSYIESLSK